MTEYARATLLKNRPLQTTTDRPRRKRSFSIPLIELLRPDSYWPQPLSIEQAFEAMRWMVETGDDKRYSSHLRWGIAGVAELLNGAGALSQYQLDPIASLADLRKRFHLAVLARPQSEGQVLWREEIGISVDSVITIKRATYRPFEGARHLGWSSEFDIQKSLTEVCTGSRGKPMAISLNSSHPRCRSFHDVSVAIGKFSGFSFLLRYGEDPSKRGASYWTKCIARSRSGESFLDTFARARDVFDCLVLGKTSDCDLAELEPPLGSNHIADQLQLLAKTATPIRTPVILADL